jgi:hypothetical protein
MRKMLIAAALGGMLILPACADYGSGAYYGAGYGGADVYYDGYYGPYTDGYWGPDAFFYYRGNDGRFIRDESRHFRREQFERARGYRARPYNRDRDGDRDFRR